MSEPFLGEIKMFGFNFAPRGWAQCDGQILPINQNQSLYSLLGTTFGGDGRTNFALPDLRSRAPVHKGDGVLLGDKNGTETVTLNTNELAAHTHTVNAAPVDGDTPVGNIDRTFADSIPNSVYGNAANLVTMDRNTGTSSGGSQAHNNIQPMLVINFCIALTGLFPSRD